MSTDELALFLRERLISIDTPVCPAEGMQWAPLSQWLPELAPFGGRAFDPLPLPAPRPAAPPSLPAPGPSPWDPPAPPPRAFPEDPTPFALTPAPAAPTKGWTDRKPHPWRRYWARMLDIAVMGAATSFMIGVVMEIVAPGQAERWSAFLTNGVVGRLADLLLTLVLVIPGNALLLGLTGGTPGKWLFGIKIVRPDGRPIGVFAALGREVRVWFQGLAMGIPFASLFTLFGAYSWLTEDGYAPWDKPKQRVALHRRGGVGQVVLALLGFALLVAIRAWLKAS